MKAPRNRPRTGARTLPHPVRTARRSVGALLHVESPILAQLVVTRRCNLACGYCNEYDHESSPVPLAALHDRVDRLAALGTVVLTLTGGEPFLHPSLHGIVERAAEHGMIVTTISNAYPITRGRIEQMNAAGLSLLQISVDNVEPNAISQKSWSKIEKKLHLLREHAAFRVNVNAVLGSSPAAQTRALIEAIRSLGFYMTVGLLHDHEGQVDPGLIGDALPRFYEEMSALCHKSVFHRIGGSWEARMLRERRAPFRCRAGARYLYVDEHGFVSYCSQRRGEPGVPLAEYDRAARRRAYDAPKGCEAHCTVACVRRASGFDGWRPQPGLVDRRDHGLERRRLPLVRR
jgi:MoaA/NifB/PqqE/SkfB family radical SAM enzyme